MVKPAIQKPGMRQVCKLCGNSEKKVLGSSSVCSQCSGSEFIDMSFVEQSQYKREIIEREKMKKFSFFEFFHFF